MDYWWVNQNQTYKQEVGGGYMWSPKQNKNGAYNQFYKNMTLAKPGDVVFSFRNQKISDFGVIQSKAISASKPSDFGASGQNWSDEGWLVSVNWYSLERVFKPKNYIQELRPTLPSKYSPISYKTGSGLQSVYLASVPEQMARVLLEKMSEKDRALIDTSANIISGYSELPDDKEDQIQHQIEQDTTIDTTEKEALIKARKGQGRYRKNLEQIETACRVTGVTDKRLLRASHTKPWRDCTNNHERLDGNNGFLLTPSIDHLFDQGYITFSDNGSIKVSTIIPLEQIRAMGGFNPSDINVGGFNQKQREYLAYHRENVFKP